MKVNKNTGGFNMRMNGKWKGDGPQVLADALEEGLGVEDLTYCREGRRMERVFGWRLQN
jgi:hypothetical protein